MLLIIYSAYSPSAKGVVVYILFTFSMWFLVATWLFAPFLFNPSKFEWQKIVDDWNKWINNPGGIGVPASKSWESRWDEEQEYMNHAGLRGRFMEIILNIRFLLYQYGLVYHLHVANGHKSLTIYGLFWLVVGAVLIVLKIVSMGRKRFSGDLRLMFRLLKALQFVGFVSIIIILFVVVDLTLGDLFVSIFAFMPTG